MKNKKENFGVEIRRVSSFTEIKFDNGGYIIPPGNDGVVYDIFRDMMAIKKDKNKEARFL